MSVRGNESEISQPPRFHLGCRVIKVIFMQPWLAAKEVKGTKELARLAARLVPRIALAMSPQQAKCSLFLQGAPLPFFSGNAVTGFYSWFFNNRAPNTRPPFVLISLSSVYNVSLFRYAGKKLERI